MIDYFVNLLFDDVVQMEQFSCLFYELWESWCKLFEFYGVNDEGDLFVCIVVVDLLEYLVYEYYFGLFVFVIVK